ncbi:ADP-ribosylation factor-like protein 13B [Gigantopelta aegis]|uniref:ADP-ribosylation factor-like protein 13B n=1 Tax=Gigantopelta aegis TaxID=1735272 RepID=UPI001B88DB43|nr:ADP-ribosylation factor-like protein 13B [Gigantopelta aegis]
MFSLMGNCVSCVRRSRRPKRPITLAVLGLDCAGKTTTAKGLTGDPLPLNIAPTVGFCSEKFSFDGFSITLFDLGGGKKIRAIWKNYLAEIYGIIYVVDSTALERIEEMQNNFCELLEHPQVSGKPVLLLANKQDKEGAADEHDICEFLNLESVVNRNKCPCFIESCSAIKGTGTKMDPNIKNGLHWLCEAIDKQFDALKERVEQDIAIEEEKRRIEKAAKAERVRKMREERKERQRRDERLGVEKEESEEEDMIDGDPFKTLDVKELEKKEKKLKEEKQKKKEQLKKLKDEESRLKSSKEGEIDHLHTPRSTRNFGPLSDPLTLTATSLDISEGSAIPRSSRLLPPLQEPLGTKFVHDESGVKQKKKKKAKHETDQANQENLTETQKTMQSVSNIEISTRSLDDDIKGKEFDDSQPLSGHGKYCTTEQIGDGAAVSPKETKLKKKKARQVGSSNGYVLQDLSNPMETEESLNSSVLEDSDIVNSTEVRKLKKKKAKRNQVMQSDEETMFSTKWNFVEDLPEVESTNLRRPNMDDENVVL